LQSFLNAEQISGLKLSFDFLLSDLRLGDHDAETIAAYQHAVAYLNMMDEISVPRYIFRFPAMVPRRFVSLLAAEDPRALTIVGYFFMLLGRISGYWGKAEAEFKALMKLIPREWRARMEWAVREFEQANISLGSKSEVVNLQLDECRRNS
jgi:hypothetical protein